jgi:hypothetical protein
MARVKYVFLLLLALSCGISSAQTTAYVTTTVSSSPSTPSATLYSGFSGLSFEKSGINKAQNTTVFGSAAQSVFESLGHGVIRVGGNSTDQALWAPNYTTSQLCLTVSEASADGKTYTCTYDTSTSTCQTILVATSANLGSGGPGCEYVTTPYSVEALNNFLTATGWKAIWSLNMCLNPNDPDSNQCATSLYTEPSRRNC